MRVPRDRSDYRTHDLARISAVHPAFNLYALESSALWDSGQSTATARSLHPSDDILKCLHRDDPQRHAYLRRRWREA